MSTYIHSDARLNDIVQNPEVIVQPLKDDGIIPNNQQLPLLVYQNAIPPSEGDPAVNAETVFHANGWKSSWRNGIYSFHHYHSTAHEVLCICRGTAKVKLGGEGGITLDVHPGDVMVLPAGVGHKNLGASSDLLVVGAYPPGPGWDLCREGVGEHKQALQNIPNVPLPPADPVYGENGPVMEYWVNPS